MTLRQARPNGGPVSFWDCPSSPSNRGPTMRVDFRERIHVILRSRMLPVVPFAVVFLVLIRVPAAPAQDSMQLDVAFKESLARGAPANEEKKSALRQRSELRAARARVGQARRGSSRHSE